MAFHAESITMTGSAVRSTLQPQPVSQLIVQSESGNSVLYIGDSGVSATDYAYLVDAGAADVSVTVGPFPAGWLNLSEVYFLGTNNEVIHLLAVTP